MAAVIAEVEGLQLQVRRPQLLKRTPGCRGHGVSVPGRGERTGQRTANFQVRLSGASGVNPRGDGELIPRQDGLDHHGPARAVEARLRTAMPVALLDRLR